MRRIKIRRFTFAVHKTLRRVFGEDAVIRTKPGLNAYIVEYAGRKIAFTSAGRLIAIGCNEHPEQSTPYLDSLVSFEIRKLSRQVENYLHPFSAGRIKKL